MINKVSQISTKKGDKGYSKDYSNNEYKKDDILFDTLGTIDELSSFLGITYHHSTEQTLLRIIQKNLQDINSAVATTDQVRRNKINTISIQDITVLETFEENFLKQTEIKPVFVLPGSDTSKEGAYFDYARTLARKSERNLVRFVGTYQREDLSNELAYLNRLSDLLFIISRYKEKE